MLKRCQQTFWHKSRIETRFLCTSFSMIEEKVTFAFLLISLFLCVRHPVTQGQLSLHCAIIGCFHSGELNDSDDCDQPVRVHGLWQSLCIPQVESVRQSCQDSCQSTFTDMQGSWFWLSGAEGGEQAFGRHGRPVAIAGWCSARATSCFWDIPFICCKNKLGIGISLD